MPYNIKIGSDGNEKYLKLSGVTIIQSSGSYSDSITGQIYFTDSSYDRITYQTQGDATSAISDFNITDATIVEGIEAP